MKILQGLSVLLTSIPQCLKILLNNSIKVIMFNMQLIS